MKRLRLGASGAERLCALGARSAASGTPGELRSTGMRPDASAGPSTSPLDVPGNHRLRQLFRRLK